MIAIASKYTPLDRLPVAVEDKARSTAVLAYAVPTWQDGTLPVYTNQHFRTYVAEGYKKNELIFSCLSANADTAASVSCKVYTRDDHKELAKHPLRQLLERPSPFLSETEFWSLCSIYEDLAGVAYFEKVRNRAGQVTSLFPLVPDYMYPIASSVEFISAYVYRVPNMSDITFDARDVLVFRRPDPTDLRQAISPMAAASRVGDVDNAITDFLKVLEEKGFQPPGVLKSKLVLNDTDVTSILSRLQQRYGGIENWNKPLVLDRDAEYQRVGMTMQEMDFTGLDARNEARICEVFQIPPIIVGAKIGLDRSTFANYQEARLSWWEDKVTPRYKRRSDVIDSQLAPEFGEDIETEFDLSQVPALQEKRNEYWKRASDALFRGAITRNMFYKEVGMEQLDPEIGDVFLIPISTQVVPLNQPIPEPVQPAQTDTPPSSDNLAQQQDNQKPTDAPPVTQEGKGIETDEQRRWFFANSPDVDAEAKAVKPTAEPFTSAEIDGYMKLYKQLTGGKNA